MKRIAFLLLLCASAAAADERILDYASDIHIEKKGGMRVEETIRVRAEDHQIRRGIYRDFPTRYKDRLGNRYVVDFDVVEVRRDGTPEPYHTQSVSNGVRVYIGDKNVFLEPGVYEYKILYTTDRQIGFFADHDELYWNATGNGWDFPIDHASARVTLPVPVPTAQMTAEAYMGAQGARGTAYRAWLPEDGAAAFETTAPLAPREGLTIVATWPKGIVDAPTTTEKTASLLRDNLSILGGGIGLLIILAYYLAVWNKVGRDPEAGVVIPEYGPPEGISPAAARFIERMGYDQRAFAAAVVNLAVKGYLTIKEPSRHKYELQKTGGAVEMAPGEAQIADALFASGSSIVLEQKNHVTIRAALKAHKEALKRDYEKKYFLRNTVYLLPALALSLIIAAITVLGMPEGKERMITMIVGIFFIFWGSVLIGILKNVISHWRGASGVLGVGQALLLTVVAIPMTLVTIGALIAVFYFGSAFVVLALLALLVLNWTFYELLKAPTRIGRKAMDKIEGFKLYLSVAEKDELNIKNPPERTPKLFETYLPYALALNVEQQWSERFAKVLAAAAADTGRAYAPIWYQGSNFSTSNLGSFSSGLSGGLSSSIASSSTAPGSSSGSGGGGFSGGGGGGGGGGGW